MSVAKKGGYCAHQRHTGPHCRLESPGQLQAAPAMVGTCCKLRAQVGGCQLHRDAAVHGRYAHAVLKGKAPDVVCADGRRAAHVEHAPLQRGIVTS